MIADTPLVSIITPTYNHRSFIGQCIDSVLSQSYENLEMIIIDDGSTDGTAEIVGEYKDSRLRYYRQEHQGIFGLADTYNRALQIAGGELIAILEGDDFWPSDKLAMLVPSFNNPEGVLAYGMTQSVDVMGKIIGSTAKLFAYYQNFPYSILHNDPIGSATRVMLRGEGGVLPFPCSTIICRQALEDIGGFQAMSDGHTVDYATFLALSLKGKFLYVPNVTGYYRRHAKAISSSALLSELVRGRFIYTMQFIRQHKEELSLSIAEQRFIYRTWERALCNTTLIEGRWLLLRNQWVTARLRFQHGLKSSQTAKQLGIAIVGCLASWLHCDIEGFYRVLGGVDFRRFEARG